MVKNAQQTSTSTEQAKYTRRKVKHMRHPFLTELFRSIGSSLTRFLAIMGIVGLGVGFFAGLNMTGRDMRHASDLFYDGTALYDLRVISTLGLTESQVERILEVDGVDQAAGGYATDVMALHNDDRFVTHITSFNVDVARTAEVDSSGAVVTSNDANYLNRLVLTEGEWPDAADECVLSADAVISDNIKIGDTVEVLYGSGSLDSVLTTLTFKVTGFVHSAQYPSNVSLGYTNLGAGSVQEVMFVSDDAFSDELPFTEVYVSVEGANEEDCTSDAYQARVDEVAAHIEDLGLGALRYQEIVSAAQEQIDAAQNEYDEGEAEAKSGLSDAESELADAKSQLDDAYKQLEDARVQLEDAYSQLVNGQAEYESGVQQLAQARAQVEAQLADARAQIELARQQLNSAEAQLGMSQADIDAAYSEYYAGYNTWQSTRAQLVSARGDVITLKSAVDTLSYYASLGRVLTDAELADARSQATASIAAARRLYNSSILDTSSAELRSAIVSLANNVLTQIAAIDFSGSAEDVAAQLRSIVPGVTSNVDSLANSVISQIDSGISQGDSTLATVSSQLAQAQSARDQIDAGWAELAAGEQTYNEQAASAQAQLDSAQQTLDNAAAQLIEGAQQYQEGKQQYEEGLQQYEEGRKQYEEGVTTYNDSRAEVDSRLSDAAAQLEAARGDISSLSEPAIYVFDRTKSTGIVSYEDDTYRIDSIASVFPFIFFLVAALVSLTTMTRMVEDERADIGTHKALGFSTARITAKYVAYAALAGISGSIVGICLLSQILPYVVQVAYSIMYCIPVLSLPMPIDLGISLLATALGVGVIFIVIFAAAAATLREVPATLMLPRAPKAGKRILLERISILWSNLSFSWKVTFRNLFRYKQRMIMTIVGVAGCTALLLTGFGLHDSIFDVLNNQSEGDDPIWCYSITVGIDADATDEERTAIEDLLKNTGNASTIAYFDIENLQIASANNDEPSSVQLQIVSDFDSFTQMINIHDRATGEKIELKSDSVILTEKMARRLGVGVGDTVTVYERDEIGNAVGDGYTFTISAVCENYVYHYMYIGDAAWEAATGKSIKTDTLYSNITDDESTRAEMSVALAENPAVASISFTSEAVESYHTSLQAVNIIVVVLVVAAAALAFIVLYNLINIQLIERTREIASLKVLGFNRREVANYLFRETVILVIVGAFIGLALGTFMEGFVVVTAEVDAIMFGRNISLLSYVYSFSLSVIFSLIVMVVVAPQLRKIDMVESLKSVD